MTPKPHRLSPAELQELVRLACPRDWVRIARVDEAARVDVLISVLAAYDRTVHVTFTRRRTVVSWVTPLDGHAVHVTARPGESEGGVALDALNLIRCAVGWLVGEDLPHWPDLTGDWEWDDPDCGGALESRRSDSDDCGGNPSGGDPGRSGRAP